MLGRCGDLAQLAPSAEPPFFFSQIGHTFPPKARKRYRVAFLAGCIANVAFARLNEATVRVLQKNGCEVVIPEGQGCCGALHVHSGLRDEARKLARRNIDAVAAGELRRHHHQRRRLRLHAEGIRRAAGRRPGLRRNAPASSPPGCGTSPNSWPPSSLNPHMGRVNATVTYQDSCHLAHGQRIRTAPRKLLAADSRPDVPRDARRRYLLRQRRHLQRGAKRDVDADPGKQDGSGELHRRGHDRHRQPRLHAAACKPACACTDRNSASCTSSRFWTKPTGTPERILRFWAG